MLAPHYQSGISLFSEVSYLTRILLQERHLQGPELVTINTDAVKLQSRKARQLGGRSREAEVELPLYMAITESMVRPGFRGYRYRWQATHETYMAAVGVHEVLTQPRPTKPSHPPK